MTGRAQQFRSRGEVETRGSFDPSCGITLAEFGGLVGAYVFPESERVKCQLVTNGSVCGQVHWHGWVARRKDGAEGYIGGDCAAQNFGADRTFTAERARVRRELRIDELVARLEGYLGDTALASRIEEAIGRHRALRSEIARIRDLWPKTIRRRLQDMAKTGNRRIVAEFQRIEVDEEGREHGEWIPSTNAVIAGVDVFDGERLRDIGGRLKASREARNAAQASRDLPERILRQWADEIGDINRCEADLDELHASLDAFLRPENLRAVCWASSNEQAQETAAAVTLELISGHAPTATQAHTARLQWASAIRAQNDGRQFRIAG
ncbi:MAG: hypothetical protein M0038_02665 [Pseudomonadota bacterium]|jgi:hypothetical protein|nr:hypothetical protein [Pseudomonadota bacterium]